jgi:hypothetical protein
MERARWGEVLIVVRDKGRKASQDVKVWVTGVGLPAELMFAEETTSNSVL